MTLFFILFRRLLHVLGGLLQNCWLQYHTYTVGLSIKRINSEVLLISLKLVTIFISHIVLFYALNDLYLFFIANPDFWPCKYLFGTYPGRQACIRLTLLFKYVLYDFDFYWSFKEVAISCFVILKYQIHASFIFIPSHHFVFFSSMLFTCATDKMVAVWDIESGERLRKLKGHQTFVNTVNPARRGPQLLCSGSDDGTVKVTYSNTTPFSNCLKIMILISSVQSLASFKQKPFYRMKIV